MKGAWALRRVIVQEKPDLIHAVALRPILLGWLALLPSPGIPVVNAITGLGSLFASEHRSSRLRLARSVVSGALRGALRHARAFNVFQNAEDLAEFRGKRYVTENRSFLIRGSGVDLAWQPVPEPRGSSPVIVFVGRLLADKGLRELVRASWLLQQQGFAHVLRIVGAEDACNPTSLGHDELENWKQHDWMEWLGRRHDVLAVMSGANMVVLPSYREGLPKVLLEAGVAQRAVVTTDVPGCRELVRHEENGLLVPVRDAEPLAEAMKRLWQDSALRDRLARCHRQVVCEQYSMEKVVQTYLGLYQRIFTSFSGALTAEGEKRV